MLLVVFLVYMVENIIISVGFLVGVIMGGFMGLYYLKTHLDSPKYLKNRLKEIEELYKGALKEKKRLTGQISQKNQIPTIEGEFDLSDPAGVGDFVKQYAPTLKKFVPDQYKHYLDSPELVDLVTSVYKSNPERANKFISNLISKKKGNKSESAPSEFDPAAAV